MMVAVIADQNQFQDLLDKHKRIMFKVVSGFTWNREDQLDLAQEIRFQLWRSFKKYDQQKLFSTWMYQVALNTAISWSRQTKLRNPISQHTGRTMQRFKNCDFMAQFRQIARHR